MLAVFFVIQVRLLAFQSLAPEQKDRKKKTEKRRPNSMVLFSGKQDQIFNREYVFIDDSK